MMSSQKVALEKRMVFILLAILGASIIYTQSRLNVKPSQSQSAATDSFSAGEVRTVLAKTDKIRVQYEEGLRDPLQKPPDINALEAEGSFYNLPGGENRAARKPEAEFLLQGIVWGGGRDFAIISGQVVSEGDLVNNAKVISITQDKVVLSRDNSKIELTR